METSDQTIPMTSVRIGDGVYQVLGVSRYVLVQRAYSPIGWNGAPRHTGWHLIVDDEWYQTYPTKRAALQACQRNPEL